MDDSTKAKIIEHPVGEDHVVLEFDPPVVVAEAPGYREVVRHAIIRLSALRRLFPSKGEPGKEKP